MSLTNKTFIVQTKPIQQPPVNVTIYDAGCDELIWSSGCYTYDEFVDDLNFEIELELDDLGGELEKILVYDLRSQLYKIRQDCFNYLYGLCDFTIYNENLEYLEKLSPMESCKIGNDVFLKFLNVDEDDIPYEAFINCTTGKITGHYSKLAPKDYSLLEYNTPKEQVPTTFINIIEQLFYLQLYSVKIIFEFIYSKCKKIFQWV